MQNRITKLFDIQHPVIQGGMVWCSGWKLAAAVSNAGGLGLIGAGSMRPEVLREHIQKTKAATKKSFGVNIPLISPYADQFIDIVLEEGVSIIFTSAGSPKKYTQTLKDKGVIVAHVVSSAKFALKSESAGVNAIVAEGFEAGGHNGREETTTFTLIELVRNQIEIPLIAAGGIATGRAVLAAQSLGAEGVQIGSLFAASRESSASEEFKRLVVDSKEGDTVLTLKKLAPVRMLRNAFCNKVMELENRGAIAEEFAELLGKGRARKGIFEGDLENGELEIGQSAAFVKQIEPVDVIMKRLITEYKTAKKQLEEFFYD